MKSVFVKLFTTGLVAAFTSLMLACSALDVPKPETFNQKVAAGYVTVTSLRNSTAMLLQADKITVKEAQNIQAQIDTAREGLDLAANFAPLNRIEAEQRLDIAVKLLQAIQSQLLARGAK